MTSFTPRDASCTRCGQSMCAALCLLMGSVSVGTPAHGQPVLTEPGRLPPPIGSTTGVVVGAMFLLSPLQPMLTNSMTAADRCLPADCFQGLVTVRANQRWQLQARLDPGVPIATPVEWIPESATSPAVPLTTGWETIGAGATPTAGQSVTLRFRVTDPAATPSAAALSAAIQYRLIALP